jgi:hypothetical protein
MMQWKLLEITARIDIGCADSYTAGLMVPGEEAFRKDL